MSEAPLAPTCRHCGATNDPGASECWLCHKGDWRADSKPRAKSRTGDDPRSEYVGCLLLITTILASIVVMAFRVGRIVGVAVLILALLVYAVTIALFGLCMVVSRI
jgi:ribosomal protein L40E